MQLQKDLKEFIELLNSHNVKYLVVGGFAMAYHGYPRTTGDIDFFIEVSAGNAYRLVTVLGAFGFGGLGLTEDDFLTPGAIIQRGYPPNRIDLVTSISGITFADAWERWVCDQVGGITMIFVDKQTLKAIKLAAGRPAERSGGPRRASMISQSDRLEPFRSRLDYDLRASLGRAARQPSGSALEEPGSRSLGSRPLPRWP